MADSRKNDSLESDKEAATPEDGNVLSPNNNESSTRRHSISSVWRKHSPAIFEFLSREINFYVSIIFSTKHVDKLTLILFSECT